MAGEPRRPPQKKAKQEEKPVLRGAAEAIAASLAQGSPLECGRPLQQLRDALLAESADASQGAAERCASLRSGLVLALCEEFRRFPTLAPLVADAPSPKVRIEVRLTAGRCLSEAFTVGRAPECDVQTSGDCTVSRLQFVVVSLPGCVLVVDAWSFGGTRIVRRSSGGRLAKSERSCRSPFAFPHGERVILFIGQRTSVTLGPADATEGATLPVELPAPRSQLVLAPAASRRSLASTAGGEGSPPAKPPPAAAPPALAPPAAKAAAAAPAVVQAASPPPPQAVQAQAPPAPAAPTQAAPAPTARAAPAQAAPAPPPAQASAQPAAAADPAGTGGEAGTAVGPKAAVAASAATAASSSAAPAAAAPAAAAAAKAPPPKTGRRHKLRVRLHLATGLLPPPGSQAAASQASPPPASQPAWAAIASRPAAGNAPARWSRALAAVRAGVRMQQAVAIRERLRWRCRAAQRAGLLTGEECGALQERLRPAEDGGDEVRDVLDGLGVPPAPDEVTPTPSQTWKCSICQETQRAKGWRCPFQHRFCRQCMVRWAEERPLPTCPSAGCGYRLGEPDLEDIRVSDAKLEAFRAAGLEEGLLALQQEEGSQAAVFRCTGSRCGAAVLLGAGEARRCWSCVCGAPPTCTGCGATPYHHHARCEDVQPLRARWLAWLQGGREAYKGLQRRAAHEATVHQRALREAMARQTELERDEQWKAEHCRLCPKCRRAVEKIDGCNTMVCGQNTHGGNRQPGCGHRFSWRDARPYKPRTGFARRAATATLARRVAVGGRGVRHLFSQCGLCGSGGKCIVGPRFRCIHCASFSCCLKCEEGLEQQHEAGHVFEILFEDEVDWASIGVELPRGTRARIRRAATAAAAAEPEGGGPQAGAGGSRKRKREEEVGLEGVIKGQRRGRYILELPDGLGVRNVLPAELQPLLTQRQAERLLANLPAPEASRAAASAAPA